MVALRSKELSLVQENHATGPFELSGRFSWNEIEKVQPIT